MSPPLAASPGAPSGWPDWSASPAENRLLAALPADERAHLLPLLHCVQVQRRQAICLADDEARWVYFPVTAVLALISLLADGHTTGVATVGCEGMAGLPALLDAAPSPLETRVVVAGAALRLRADIFRHEVRSRPILRDLLLRYAQVFLDQAAHGLACVRHHAVKQRLANLLLQLSNGRAANQIPVTQEDLAELLGVGRPRVTLATETLQEARLIDSRRGAVSITDELGLQAIACECYRALREEHSRLFS
jgi:CRP-like cAMP-binding protein